MTTPVTIDLITEDHKNGEWVLYLVEDGPWPTVDSEWRSYLMRIQQRVLAAVDIAVDGHLAAKYPDSQGCEVRIQVDSPSGSPKRLDELIEALKRFLGSDPVYSKAIEDSGNIRGLRVVTGREMGRFIHQ